MPAHTSPQPHLIFTWFVVASDRTFKALLKLTDECDVFHPLIGQRLEPVCFWRQAHLVCRKEVFILKKPFTIGGSGVSVCLDLCVSNMVASSFLADVGNDRDVIYGFVLCNSKLKSDGPQNSLRCWLSWGKSMKWNKIHTGKLPTQATCWSSTLPPFQRCLCEHWKWYPTFSNHFSR
jgi:hypothetical protein